MHWYNWLDFEHILDAAEGANIKGSIVLKRNTDKICDWILRSFSKFICRMGACALVISRGRCRSPAATRWGILLRSHQWTRRKNQQSDERENTSVVSREKRRLLPDRSICLKHARSL